MNPCVDLILVLIVVGEGVIVLRNTQQKIYISYRESGISWQSAVEEIFLFTLAATVCTSFVIFFLDSFSLPLLGGVFAVGLVTSSIGVLCARGDLQEVVGKVIGVPGSETGPCCPRDKRCGDERCETLHSIAWLDCPLCWKNIGYNSPYRVYDDRRAHAVCIELHMLYEEVFSPLSPRLSGTFCRHFRYIKQEAIVGPILETMKKVPRSLE